MKFFLKEIGFYLIFLCILIIICSLLNLIGINETITNAIIFIFNTVMFIIIGIKTGKLAKKQGYLAGLKNGAILIIILSIINIIVKNFSITTMIYYIILLLCSSFGGMIGINKKNKDSN